MPKPKEEVETAEWEELAIKYGIPFGDLESLVIREQEFAHTKAIKEARTKKVLKGERQRIISQIREEERKKYEREIAKLIKDYNEIINNQDEKLEKNIRQSAIKKCIEELLPEEEKKINSHELDEYELGWNQCAENIYRKANKYLTRLKSKIK